MHDKKTIHAKFRLCRAGFSLNVDLELSGQGTTVIQGPSGSGKTTLLRCLAGLEQPREAFLHVNGKLWQDTAFCLPPHQRPIGYVFQEDNLFEHLSAMQNMLFGCRDRSRIPAELMPIIESLGIAHLLNRHPAELSGGERQRVAIARALAVNPEVLLMDEPLSALDVSRRNQILTLLLNIQATRKIPVIYVTHDHHEAAQLAEQIIHMDEGKVTLQTSN